MKEMRKLFEEGRGKIFFIPRERILQLFVKNPKESVVLSNFSLPGEWVLREVYYDVRRSGFGFIIFSKDFAST